jgi:deazaflavin-dependent oxidoreductase (nitroreductase family)
VSDWNEKVIEEFRANEGRVGGPFEGGTLLLLHHKGAKSGVERVAPLAYLPGDDRMVIVASAAGAPKHPDWYYNLRANPDTTCEIGTETVAVRAEELTGDDYDATWQRLVARMPNFAEYQKKTTRKIPLFALRRTS